MALSLSPSIVDQYHYWRNGNHRSQEQELKAHAELVAAVKGEKGPPSDHMLRGRGGGAVLAGEGITDVKGVATWDPDSDTRFDAADVVAIRGKIPDWAVFEAWGQLYLDEIDVEMNLRADALAAPEIHEIKAPNRISTERYADSCQWRAYLLAFGCQVCVYHLCRLGKPRGSDVYYLAEYRPFRLYAYEGMREDLVFQVAECKRYLESKGLAHYRQKER